MSNPFANFRLNYKYVDRTFWVIFLLLIVVSVLALFSASSTIIHKAMAEGKGPLGPIGLQIFYICFGIGVAWILQFLPTWVYRLFGYLLFGFGLVFLILNACHIGHVANNAYRWVKIGGITIQSAELAKIGLIIVVSHLLTKIRDKETEFRYFLWVLGLTALTCLLIMIGNLSTAILLGLVVFLLMFLARIPWQWLSGIILAVVIFLLVGFFFIKKVYIEPGRTDALPKILKRAPVWVNRVDHWFAPDKTSKSDTYVLTGDNYQPMLARVAVALGGVRPWGVLPGNSFERDHLPEANSDFIFAIIVEESGIIGAFFLCFLYLSILFRCCYASSRYPDYSSQLMIMGLGLMISLQAFISMEVAVGLGPVTGQPLPLISKGGTSAIITSIYFGMMMGVAREQNKRKAMETETAEESMVEVPDLTIEEKE